MNRRNLKSILLLLAILLAGAMSFTSCEKEKDDPDPKPQPVEIDPVLSFNRFIYDAMVTEKIYLWYDNMTINQPEDYTNSNEYLYSMIYDELDRWSYTLTLEQYNSYFIEGKFYGFGFGRRWDDDNQLRISFVIPDSPFERNGITRGYIIKKIDGHPVNYILNNNLFGRVFGENQAGVTVEFVFETPTGETIVKNITKEEVIESPVMYYNVYEINGKKVGYVFFYTFIETAYDQLESVFAEFSAEGVTQMIFDLRYNTGGSVQVAEYIANLILGNEHEGKLFYTNKHNKYITEYDKNYILEKVANGLDTEKIAFITSKSSASASELLVNCVDPFIETAVIGGDTYGKPVGMYVLQHTENVLLPVSFKTVNRAGIGDYYTGIPANAYIRDGLEHDFGDTQEDCLKEALYWLEHGNFSGGVTKKTASREVPFRKGEIPENKFRAAFPNIDTRNIEL